MEDKGQDESYFPRKLARTEERKSKRESCLCSVKSGHFKTWWKKNKYPAQAGEQQGTNETAKKMLKN